MGQLTFNKSTDTKHKVELEPSIISIDWLSGRASAGQKVKFEISTEFVGYNAPIRITGKSENGKKLGKIKATIRNNRYLGELDVPEDIEQSDTVYLEIKLPKNDLSGESPRIPAGPAIRITEFKWSEKEARRGDILTMSATISGVADGTEATVTIYEFDKDRVHDKITELPAQVGDGKIEVRWEYEYHEDTDEIPIEDELADFGSNYNPPEYFFTVKLEGNEFGRKQESKLLLFKDWIEIEGEDAFGNPLKDGDYILTLPDGTKTEGKLDGDGRAAVKDVPPGACQLEFPEENGDSGTNGDSSTNGDATTSG